MCMKLLDYVWSIVLVLILLLGASFLLRNASDNDRELAEYSKCVDYHVAHDGFKGELRSSWAYYESLCNQK